MPHVPRLYFITNRHAFPGDESACQQQLLQKIAEATRVGVDYIQLREKDLSTRDLQSLAQEAIRIVSEIRRETRNPELATKLLVNSRVDVALAAGADGVHLRSDDISPAEVKAIMLAAQGLELETRHFLTAVSCHSQEEVRRAAHNGADFAVMAPIFGKEFTGRETQPVQPLGLDALQAARNRNEIGREVMGGNAIPVFALGGVTLENAKACLSAGALGIAGIRLFQENDIAATVRRLRS
jgi:thiamine-phosphate pyrophosphorylase